MRERHFHWSLASSPSDPVVVLGLHEYPKLIDSSVPDGGAVAEFQPEFAQPLENVTVP